MEPNMTCCVFQNICRLMTYGPLDEAQRPTHEQSGQQAPLGMRPCTQPVRSCSDLALTAARYVCCLGCSVITVESSPRAQDVEHLILVSNNFAKLHTTTADGCYTSFSSSGSLTCLCP